MKNKQIWTVKRKEKKEKKQNEKQTSKEKAKKGRIIKKNL